MFILQFKGKLRSDYFFTGDTTFEVFTSPPNADLLKVKTLITEATYIDDDTDKLGRNSVEKARKYLYIFIT